MKHIKKLKAIVINFLMLPVTKKKFTGKANFRYFLTCSWWVLHLWLFPTHYMTVNKDKHKQKLNGILCNLGSLLQVKLHVNEDSTGGGYLSQTHIPVTTKLEWDQDAFETDHHTKCSSDGLRCQVNFVHWHFLVYLEHWLTYNFGLNLNCQGIVITSFYQVQYLHF